MGRYLVHCQASSVSSVIRSVQCRAQRAHDLRAVRNGKGNTQRAGKEFLQAGIPRYTAGKDEPFLYADTADHSADPVDDGLVQSQGDPVAVVDAGGNPVRPFAVFDPALVAGEFQAMTLGLLVFSDPETDAPGVAQAEAGA